ncbi:MAG: hypothetical protein QM644_14940 [Mobilitalea sp.]
MNIPFLRKFFDICLALLVFFLFPLVYFSLKQDAVRNIDVEVGTSNLLNEIEYRGYLSKEMYEDYQEELSNTGLLYTINLKHERIVYEPIYRFRTSGEVIEDQDNSYTGSNDYHYYPISTDKPIVNDPVNSGTLNTETNASVLASAVNIPASPTHIHSDACYLGTKHTHTGSNTLGTGCYAGGTYVSGSSCSNASILGSVYLSTQYIPCYTWCGGAVEVKIYSINITCSSGHSTSKVFREEVNKIGTHKPDCNVESVWMSVPTTCGVSNPGTYSLNCGKTAGAYYDGNTQISAICNQFVTSIVPTHPIQTVAIGDPLITTVRASYMDGSEKVVVANSTFLADNPVQNKIDILTYSYSIGTNAYSKTSNVTVSVIPRNKTCSNGHTYNLNNDGSDPGCPYCKAWLKKLEIATPASGNLTIYSGTTLVQNGVTLLATYLDGRTELLMNEYVDNLDMGYIGVQNVTVSYKGLNVTLSVANKRKLIECSTCHRRYELYPDGSDPGCPYCAALTPIFTGEITEYYVDNYTEEILKELYEGAGIYYMSKNDYFTIDTQNNGKSLGERLTSGIYMFDLEGSIRSKQGDYIREDSWQ